MGGAPGVESARFGRIEAGRSDGSGSASKAVVDSRNPALLAVGAIDPASSDGGRASARLL